MPATETKDAYAPFRESKARWEKIAAQTRAVAAGKGKLLPDDAEPPFDPNPKIIPDGYVRVRVLRRGDDKISMGLTLPLEDNKFPNFRQGDEFVMPAKTADEFENGDLRIGWIEILSE